MWSDNETTTDLIGFRVHTDLIRAVVTDSNLLPVVLGVFGDWGGGKSSIMKMLEKDLNSDEHQDTACLYFNGWMFEGYEDAKTALLSSILIELGEHKRFGPAVKEKVTGLLKRVKVMELAKLGIKHVGVPLAMGALAGGVGAIPAAAAALLPQLLNRDTSEKKAESKESEDGAHEGINWLDLIETDMTKPDLLEIRKFRTDFEKMLATTDIKSLVILIDDLDRCLPERIIETLEAIKLFVAVPKTAFVVGADPRIVKHAIALRYVDRQVSHDVAATEQGEATTEEEKYNLVQDYLEKLIQIPYYLPRLSPAEIETYINLLACQKNLATTQCQIVLEHWAEKRRTNFYAAYQHGSIKEALGNDDAIPGELERMLSWSSSIALVITEGLKGNPRQVKRMLNAMLLRKRLAQVAGISIKDEVLAKLMVLEYAHERRLRDLNNWQAAAGGYPLELKELESWALSDEGEEKISLRESLSNWNKPSLRSWLRMQPPLSDVDLRDYFWLARDRTSSTLSGVQMVSPLVRRILDQLIGGNDGEQVGAARDASELEETERESLLDLLQQQVERHPDQISGPKALFMLAEQKLEGAAQTLFQAVRNAPANQLEPGVVSRIEILAKMDPNLTKHAKEVLEQLRTKTTTKAGRAAEKSLKGWE
jgi:predicted KAP-like P-loop ATPase